MALLLLSFLMTFGVASFQSISESDVASPRPTKVDVVVAEESFEEVEVSQPRKRQKVTHLSFSLGFAPCCLLSRCWDVSATFFGLIPLRQLLLILKKL